MLHGMTRDPHYVTVAAAMAAALNMTRVKCGYTRILNVETGERALCIRAHCSFPTLATRASALSQQLLPHACLCRWHGPFSDLVHRVAFLPAPGKHDDLMESYFLSETAKYLYLTFEEGAHHITDWWAGRRGARQTK